MHGNHHMVGEDCEHNLCVVSLCNPYYIERGSLSGGTARHKRGGVSCKESTYSLKACMGWWMVASGLFHNVVIYLNIIYSHNTCARKSVAKWKKVIWGNFLSVAGVWLTWEGILLALLKSQIVSKCITFSARFPHPTRSRAFFCPIARKSGINVKMHVKSVKCAILYKKYLTFLLLLLFY